MKTTIIKVTLTAARAALRDGAVHLFDCLSSKRIHKKVIFAARCYASAAYAVMRCMSVTFIHSVKMNKHIFKIFSPSGSNTILAFLTKQHGNIPTGTP